MIPEPAKPYTKKQYLKTIQSYIELALDAYDITDLAGLPENDSRLATASNVALRKLYQPIRVVIETSGMDNEIITAQLEQIEYLRESQRLKATEASINKPTKSGLTNELENELIIPSSIGERLSIAQQIIVLGDPGEGKTTLLRWLMTAYLLKSKANVSWQDQLNRLAEEVETLETPDLPQNWETPADDQQTTTESEECHNVDFLPEFNEIPATTACDQLPETDEMQAATEFAELPDVETLPEADWLPILIRGRYFESCDSVTSVDDILRQALSQIQMTPQEIDILLAVLKEELAKGQILLLVDGLDEITDATKQASFLRQIDSVVTTYPKTPIVMTSRIVGCWDRSFKKANFEHVTIHNWSFDDKIQFLQSWYAITEPNQNPKQLAKELIESTGRDRLFNNFMLLTALALVKRKMGELPQDIFELYAEIVQVLFNWQSKMQKPIAPNEVIPQLEYVAYEMSHHGIWRLQEDELLKFLQAVRQDYPDIQLVNNHTAEAFLPLLKRRTHSIFLEVGIVQHDALSMPVFEFQPAIFQEYFAHCAMSKKQFTHCEKPLLNDKQSSNVAAWVELLTQQTSRILEQLLKINKIQKPLRNEWEREKCSIQTELIYDRWKEKFSQCFAHCIDDEGVNRLINAIVTPTREEDVFLTTPLRARLLALSLAEQPNISDKINESTLHKFDREMVDSLMTNLSQGEALVGSLMTKLIKATAIAVQVVDDIKIQSNVEALITKLDDDNFEVREAAVLALGEFKDPRAIEPLIDKLNDSDSQVKGTVARILGEFKEPRAVKPLIQQLVMSERRQQDFQDFWREENLVRNICVALCNIQDSSVIEPLIATLEDENSEIRRYAIIVLGILKDSRAVEPLIAKLEDENLQVQVMAIRALANIKDLRAVEPLVAKLAQLGNNRWGGGNIILEALDYLKQSNSTEPFLSLEENRSSSRRSVFDESDFYGYD